MKTISAYLRWIFWTGAYACRAKPGDLAGYLLRSKRTRPPRWKFRPSLFHNENGKQWEIRFDDESSYSRREVLQVEVQRGMETGRIVGLTIWDEKLRKVEPESGAQMR